jgi:DNA invertase Pin-like site-specific DNA recombinase
MAQNCGIRVAIYCRVSTDSQTVENQVRELQEVASRSNWNVVGIYSDQGISGAKDRAERPQLDALIKDANKRKFDMIACWSIDRLGRSIQTLVQFMNDMNAIGVDLYFHQQALNTKTASGRMVFSIFSALGEYERELIRERINAGLARAKAQGKKLGRPSNVNPSVITSVRLLREKGHSIHTIAKQLHIGVGTTQKILASAA